MSAVITPFEGTELFNTASFNNRISQINTGFSYVSNPNLLDNWYFGRPVNQRGQTEYNTMNYAIDRWRTWTEPTSAWLKVVDGGIKAAYTFFQYFEKAVIDGILGKNVTISILFADGKLFYTTGFISKSGISYLAVDTNYGNVAHVALGVDTSNTGDSASNYFRVAITELGTLSDTILAIKLELGSRQTLAHQDANGNWVLNEIPDYGEQLRRCQRYSKVYGSIQPNFGQPFFCAGFYRVDSGFVQLTMVCPEFRKTPVVSILDGDWALFDGENVYAIGEINVIAYMPGVITLGITSPGNSFSNGKILILFANSGKLILSADL